MKKKIDDLTCFLLGLFLLVLMFIGLFFVMEPYNESPFIFGMGMGFMCGVYVGWYNKKYKKK